MTILVGINVKIADNFGLINMKKYIIEDWAGNRLFPTQEFETFEDGWDFIYDNIHEDSEDDGTYDDVYVIEK